jgi:2-hydroxy-3-keto-5-methylthiopentenyl-1-phosphate phosphatase
MSSKPSYKRIVFCDFDGTITVEETFSGMLEVFASRNYHRTARQVGNGSITLKEGVRRLVESIPSDRYPQVIDYIRDKQIREGFAELLDLLYLQGIPFVVISGGLLDSVTTRLREHAGRIHAIHAPTVTTDGPTLKLLSRWEGETETLAKTDVMAAYRYEQAAAIGDGITDRNMAMAADIVFARDSLAEYMRSTGKTHIGWKDFYDVIDHLTDRWLKA